MMLLILFLVIQTEAHEYECIVQSNSGLIEGKLVNDFGVSYYSFQGIPYAESPTGDLRFKPPVPKKPWLNLLDATKPGHVCVQQENVYKKEQMSEDCLFLNIYVPVAAKKGPATEKLPVLVYVHGGEFSALSGNDDYQYGPQLLMKADIIFVTLNYRLGALGFLSLGVHDASGNAGIKDVFLALRWVQANIEVFGGNRDKVTIGGNSAGAALVNYLLLSDKSTGLFHQAVLISGSALGYRFLNRYPIKNAFKLGKQLGIETNNTDQLLKKLKEKDPFDIVKATNDMGLSDKRKALRSFSPFVPCVEIESLNAVITRPPIEIIQSGIPQNIPILAGVNSKEGIRQIPVVNQNQTLLDLLNEDFQLTIPSNIEYPYGLQESQELASSIRQFYFDNENISNSTIEGFIDLVRDTQYTFSTDQWIKLHKQSQENSSIYYYLFDFDGELNWFKVRNNVSVTGTSHADELGYIFVTNATKSILNNIDSRTQKMVQIWRTVLKNFVTFGNPTPNEADIGVLWSKTDLAGTHVILSDAPVLRTDFPPFPVNLLFWYNIYDIYNEYVKNEAVWSLTLACPT